MADIEHNVSTRSRGRRRSLLRGVAAVLVLLLAFWWLLPAPIDPAPYAPPAGRALLGPLAPNTALREADLLGLGQVAGPEDVEVADDGTVYAGLEDGRIVRFRGALESEAPMEIFADTGGRPLGLELDAAGHLIVADAVRGLLSVDSRGEVVTLATEAEGVPFRFTDDVDVASDGTFYFSDASSQYGHEVYLYDLLEARPHGRLMAYDPATRRVRVLLKDLYFANGVALSQDEDFVLVNETYRYRIRRYWLRGPKAGTTDIFLDNLPGFPDGVSSNRRGTFWVALFTVRNRVMDRLHPHPALKRLVSKLPGFLWPRPEPYGLVVGVDEAGQVVASFHDPGGAHLQEITSVEEHGGSLYLGSLHADRIGRLRLPEE